MNRDEFKVIFKLLASPSCRSDAAIDLKEPSYWEVLRNFERFIFLEVVEVELRNDNRLDEKLRPPAYYKAQCIHESRRKKRVEENARKDPEYGRRPRDLEAMKNFYAIVFKLHDEKAKTDIQHNGFSNMAYCIGQAFNNQVKQMERVNQRYD